MINAGKVDIARLYILAFAPVLSACHVEPLLDHVYNNAAAHDGNSLKHEGFCAIYIGTEEQCRAEAKKRISGNA